MFLHRSCSDAYDLPQIPSPVVEELFEPSRFLERAKGDHPLRALERPEHPGLLQACAEDCLASAFDWAGADEEVAPGLISLADGIANPRLLGHTNDGNWMTEIDETLWEDTDGKTIYDPCPPGYRVPTPNSNAPFWSGDLTSQTGWVADGTNGWLTIGDPVTVFPIAGYRDDYSVGGMSKVGSRTLIWTSRGAEGKASCADLRYDKGTFKFGSAPKARLGSVRCVTE